MGIGSGIFLFVVGVILAFALNISVTWVNLHLVGYILMAAGAVIFLIALVLVFRRRSTIETTRGVVDPVSGERVSKREIRSDDPTIEP